MRFFTSAAVLGAAVAAPMLAWGDSPLRLSVEPGANRSVVTLVLENVSDEPTRVYVDGRMAEALLHGDGRRLLRCRATLPANAAGQRRDARMVTLAPGDSVREPLDLRYQCFGRRMERLERADLVRVYYRSRVRTDRLGQEAWTGRLGPAEAPLSRPAEPEARETPPTDAPAGDTLSLRLVGGAPDARDGSFVPLTLELRAPSRARLPVVIRPELFSLEVAAPSGEVSRCGLPASSIRPLRDFFDVLGSRRITLDLASLCGREQLSRAGLYELRPSFESTFDGSDVGLEAWTGRVEGESILLRIRNALPGADEPVEIDWGRRPLPSDAQIVEAD